MAEKARRQGASKKKAASGPPEVPPFPFVIGEPEAAGDGRRLTVSYAAPGQEPKPLLRLVYVSEGDQDLQIVQRPGQIALTAPWSGETAVLEVRQEPDYDLVRFAPQGSAGTQVFLLQPLPAHVRLEGDLPGPEGTDEAASPRSEEPLTVARIPGGTARTLRLAQSLGGARSGPGTVGIATRNLSTTVAARAVGSMSFPSSELTSDLAARFREEETLPGLNQPLEYQAPPFPFSKEAEGGPPGQFPMPLGETAGVRAPQRLAPAASTPQGKTVPYRYGQSAYERPTVAPPPASPAPSAAAPTASPVSGANLTPPPAAQPSVPAAGPAGMPSAPASATAPGTVPAVPPAPTVAASEPTARGAQESPTLPTSLPETPVAPAPTATPAVPAAPGAVTVPTGAPASGAAATATPPAGVAPAGTAPAGTTTAPPAPAATAPALEPVVSAEAGAPVAAPPRRVRASLQPPNRQEGTASMQWLSPSPTGMMGAGPAPGALPGQLGLQAQTAPLIRGGVSPQLLEAAQASAAPPAWQTAIGTAGKIGWAVAAAPVVAAVLSHSPAEAAAGVGAVVQAAASSVFQPRTTASRGPLPEVTIREVPPAPVPEGTGTEFAGGPLSVPAPGPGSLLGAPAAPLPLPGAAGAGAQEMAQRLSEPALAAPPTLIPIGPPQAGEPGHLGLEAQQRPSIIARGAPAPEGPGGPGTTPGSKMLPTPAPGEPLTLPAPSVEPRGEGMQPAPAAAGEPSPAGPPTPAAAPPLTGFEWAQQQARIAAIILPQIQQFAAMIPPYAAMAGSPNPAVSTMGSVMVQVLLAHITGLQSQLGGTGGAAASAPAAPSALAGSAPPMQTLVPPAPQGETAAQSGIAPYAAPGAPASSPSATPASGSSPTAGAPLAIGVPGATAPLSAVAAAAGLAPAPGRSASTSYEWAQQQLHQTTAMLSPTSVGVAGPPATALGGAASPAMGAGAIATPAWDGSTPERHLIAPPGSGAGEGAPAGNLPASAQVPGPSLAQEIATRGGQAAALTPFGSPVFLAGGAPGAVQAGEAGHPSSFSNPGVSGGSGLQAASTAGGDWLARWRTAAAQHPGRPLLPPVAGQTELSSTPGSPFHLALGPGSAPEDAGTILDAAGRRVSPAVPGASGVGGAHPARYWGAQGWQPPFGLAQPGTGTGPGSGWLPPLGSGAGSPARMVTHWIAGAVRSLTGPDSQVTGLSIGPPAMGDGLGSAVPSLSTVGLSEARRGEIAGGVEGLAPLLDRRSATMNQPGGQSMPLLVRRHVHRYSPSSPTSRWRTGSPRATVSTTRSARSAAPAAAETYSWSRAAGSLSGWGLDAGFAPLYRGMTGSLATQSPRLAMLVPAFPPAVEAASSTGHRMPMAPTYRFLTSPAPAESPGAGAYSTLSLPPRSSGSSGSGATLRTPQPAIRPASVQAALRQLVTSSGRATAPTTAASYFRQDTGAGLRVQAAEKNRPHPRGEMTRDPGTKAGQGLAVKAGVEGEGPSPTEIDLLARQVYRIVKQRLATERERRGGF